MDKQVPCKRIQVKNVIPEFASSETRDKIRLRDIAITRAKTTFSIDDEQEFKSLRNLVHKLLRKDKEKYIKDKFDDAQGDSKKQRKCTKDQIGWTKNLSPEMINNNGKLIRDPIGIADSSNMAQISRNLKLHRDIRKDVIDHKINYHKLTQN